MSFLEISAIVIRTLDQMARNAIRIIRNMTATMDAILQSDGFRIGRSFLVTAFQSIGGAVGTAYNGLKSFGEGAVKLGGDIYNWLYLKLNAAGKAIVAFGIKAKAAGAKLLLILGPKGLIIAAIAAIVGAVVGWVKNCEDAQEKLRMVWEKIRAVIEPVINFIKDLVGRVFGWIQGFIDDHGETIMGIFRVVWDTISGIFERVVENIQSVLRQTSVN